MSIRKDYNYKSKKDYNYKFCPVYPSFICNSYNRNCEFTYKQCFIRKKFEEGLYLSEKIDSDSIY